MFPFTVRFQTAGYFFLFAVKLALTIFKILNYPFKISQKLLITFYYGNSFLDPNALLQKSRLALLIDTISQS